MTSPPTAAVPVVGLDAGDAGDTDGADIGAKALALARARRRGLPALPGIVVPASAGRALVEQALAASGGGSPHAATLAVMDAAVHLDWTAVVEAARRLGDRLVVRSSSPVEGDPSWSGAFSSFLEVAPDEVPTAVAGCWASACNPTVLDLCDRMGRTPEEVSPAVLVQPMVAPDAGGTATVERGAGRRAPAVEIAGVPGSPAPLLAGWVSGWSARVTGDGEDEEATHGAPRAVAGRGGAAEPGPEDALPPARWLHAVARLARLAGDGAAAAIEWAIVDDGALLLQLRAVPVGAERASDEPSRDEPSRDEPASGEPANEETTGAAPVGPETGGGAGGAPGGGGSPTWTAARGARGGGHALAERPSGLAASPRAPSVARAVFRYGGPLGEELVLPWLLADPGAQPVVGAEPVTGADPGRAGAALDGPEAFDATVAAARALAARALGGGTADLAGVAEDLPGALDALAPVPAAEGRAVLAGLAAAARQLVEAGALAHDEELWALTASEVRARLATPVPGGGRPARYRLARWLPLLGAVMERWGRAAGGEGASPGAAAGRARRLRAPADLRRVVRGDVVVVERPAPQLAPALWAASALVAESGGAAAHLAEVARSLRVPAVVAAGRLDVTDGRTLVLVDGDAGRVLLLDG